MLAEGTFDGKVAIVTGGGSGLGRAIASSWAPRRRGRGGRAEARAARGDLALVTGSGGRGLAVPTDVRDPEAVDASSPRRSRARAGGRARQQRRGQLRRQGEDLSPNGWRAVVHRARRRLPLLARGREADDRAGRRRLHPERDRELRLDGWPRHDPLGRRQGGARGDDEDARRRVGAARDPRQLHLPGPTDTEGAGAALWPTEEDRARVAATVPLGRLATPHEVAVWATALCSTTPATSPARR